MKLDVVKFECAISSNLNLIDVIKLKKIYSTQNIGILFSRFNKNLVLYISANIKEVMWLYVWYVIKWKNEIWIEFYFDVVSIGNEIGYSQIWMGDKFEL